MQSESAIEQTIGFATSPDGVKLAYAFSGQGRPLVKTANWLTHIDHDSRSPFWRHWLEFLSSRSRLLRYDERGNGLSDHHAGDVGFERWVEDLETLVATTGLDRFSLIGISQGGAVAIEYAARYPDKVEQLILYGAYARGWARRGDEQELRRAQALLELVESGWGEENPAYRQIFTNLFAPDADEEQAAALTELQRLATDPATAARLITAAGNIDVQASLGKVRAPTLVMHARDDARVPFDQGRELAASINGARFVPLDSRNHALLGNEPAWDVFKAEFRSFFAADDTAPPASLSIDPRFGELTPRELAVTERVAAGLDNAAVGEQLGISAKTVRNHLTRIFDKLGVQTRAQLIVRVRGSSRD